jgi:hypothetical protein
MRRRTFERLLEQCLQEAARTGDAEAALKRYPQHADRLRPLVELALAARDDYADVPAPPGELAAGRRRLLEAAAQRRRGVPLQGIPVPTQGRKPKMKLMLASRIIGAMLAIVIGTVAVGGGAAVAAADSLPGDALYPMKLAVEDLRLALASGPEAQVGLALDLADERLAEIEALLEEGLPVPEDVVGRMEQHLYRAMVQAAQAPDGDMPGLLARIAQRTQTQAQLLEQVQWRMGSEGSDTPGQVRTRVENTLQLCLWVATEARNGVEEPATYRWRVQERENMPEDVAPPEPPDRENGPSSPPQGPPEQPGGQPGGPPEAPGGDPQQQGNQQGDQQQDQNQNQDQQQNQDRLQSGSPPVTPVGTPQGNQNGNGPGGSFWQP